MSVPAATSPTVWRALAVVTAILSILTIISGCAINYIDRNGDQRVLGFVNAKIPAADEESAGYTVDVSAVGALLFISPVQSGIALGYGRERSTVLKNDVIVIENLEDDSTSESTD